ncbi:MAG: hypothetical protein BMS9Abin15_0366 [Gammaproteobacteria bacterium]|nr:MAG: hypothetical protein BMS9Abin15_0366 [Gammaproteobacteria bacterium]
MSPSHIPDDVTTSIKRRLGIGFGILLILLSSITAIGLLRLQLTDRSMEQVVHLYHFKTELVTTMQNALQQRRYSLHMMTLLQDEFAAELEWEQFTEAASNYLLARSKLLATELTNKERESLQQLDEATLFSQPLQLAVLDKLEQKDRQSAITMLFEKARPAQNEVITKVTKLYSLIRSLNKEAANKAIDANKKAILGMSVLGFSVVLLGIVIAIGIVRRAVKQAREIEYQQRKYKSLFDANLDAVLLWDNMRMIQSNQAALDLFAIDNLHETNLHLDNLLPESQPEGGNSRAIIGEQFVSASSGSGVHFELSLNTLDGETFPAEILLNTVAMDNEKVHQMVVRDITSRREAESRIEHLAFYDALTDLPNKALMQDRLMHALAQASHSGHQVALLLVNQRRFKYINESLGNEAGDIVLKEVAARLGELLGEQDLLARIGSDEFALIFTNLENVDAAVTLANQALDVIKKPILAGSRELIIGASIGIAIYPRHGLTADELLQDAQTALHRARELGSGQFQLFDEAMAEKVSRQLVLENDFQKGLSKKEFEVYYQPKFSASDKMLLGMEALIRWSHSKYGLLEPPEFIALAEDTNQILPVGEWVIRTACRDAQHLRTHGFEDLRVAINLSPKQFHDPELITVVDKILEETGLDPHFLEFEITESAIFHGEQETNAILIALKKRGISLTLDDFGTGYSSLGFLSKLPLDCIKIDRTFIKQIPDSVPDMEIISLIITLAHKMGHTIVAEGVETREQYDYVKAHQCDAIQGNYLGKAMPISELEQFVKKESAA